MNMFQIVFVPLCAGMAFLVVLRTVRGHMSRRGGAFWSILWLTGAVLIAAPTVSVVLARWLGIGRGSDLIFYVAIIAGVASVLYFHSRYRKLEILVTELVRRYAIEHAERGADSSYANSSLFGPEHDNL